MKITLKKCANNHYRGIPTSYIKYVLVISLCTEQKYIYIYPPLSSGVILITENSKVQNPNSHTNLKLKEKDSIPSSQDI